MKKLLTLLLLSFSFLSFGQENNPLNNNEKSFEDIVKPYLEKTLNGLEKGIEFAKEEIPLIIKEYLQFKSIEYILILILSIVLIFVGFWIQKKYFDDWDTPKSIAGFVVYMFGFVTFCCHIVDFIKVTFFPKLYLLEKFINIIQ